MCLLLMCFIYLFIFFFIYTISPRPHMQAQAQKLAIDMNAMFKAIQLSEGEVPDQDLVKILAPSICRLAKLLIPGM